MKRTRDTDPLLPLGSCCLQDAGGSDVSDGEARAWCCKTNGWERESAALLTHLKGWVCHVIGLHSDLGNDRTMFSKNKKTTRGLRGKNKINYN